MSRFLAAFATSLLFLSCLLMAQTKSSPAGKASASRSSALDKVTLEAYARHLFVWGPQIKVEITDPKPSALPGFQEVTVKGSMGAASHEVLFYVSRDGRKMVQGTVYDVTQNPFKADIDKIKVDGAASIGPPGAPVVIVMFSDFECGFCREEAKMVRANLIKEFPQQVRLYFKDFPLEQIHQWAKMAAIAGRCIYRQNPVLFWDYHDWIFERQGDIRAENVKDKILEFAKGKPLDALQLTRCLETRETEAEVNRTAGEARALNVTSTPTMFVNGRRLVGQLAWPNLKQIIEFEIGYQKTARNAGDKACCEVPLPSPLPK